MTYEAILKKAVLDIDFRNEFLINPLSAIKQFGIAIDEGTFLQLKNFSIEKFNEFLEYLMEESLDPSKGYM